MMNLFHVLPPEMIAIASFGCIVTVLFIAYLDKRDSNPEIEEIRKKYLNRHKQHDYKDQI